MIVTLLFVKATVIVTAAATLHALAGRKTSAATRHLLWTLTVVALLLLPGLSASLPEWTPIRVSPQPVVTVSATVERAAARIAAPVLARGRASHATTPAVAPGNADAWRLLAFSYVAGVVLLLGRLLFQSARVRGIRRRAAEIVDPEWRDLLRECREQMHVGTPVRLLRSLEPTMPMTFGIRDAVVLIPAVADTWDRDRRRAVLLHELAHVSRRDCLMQTIAAVVCAAYWVHPGVWWIARRLRADRELACDDRVLAAGTDAHRYAEHLLDLAYSLASPATAVAVSIAHRDQVEGRLRALLDAARNRTTPSTRRRLGGVAIMAVVVVTIATATNASGDVTDAGASDGPRRSSPLQHFHHVVVRALRNGTVSYFAEMVQLGYADPSGLAEARHRGVTPAIVREFAARGYTSLDLDELVALVSHGVTPAFVDELGDQGFKELSVDGLIEARSHGISPDYIMQMRTKGYLLPMEDLLTARSHGIDPEYIGDLAALGYKDLSIDNLITLRSHGVDADFVHGLRELGYTGLSPDELVELRRRGVSLQRIRTANAQSGDQLSVDELVERASHGWR